LSTESVRSEIDTLLRRPAPWSFPPLLEAQYRARNNVARRGTLMVAMALAAIVVLAGLGTDLLAGTPVFSATMMPRIGAALLCLVASFMLYRVRQAWHETLLLAVPTLGVLAVLQLTTELIMAHNPAYAQYLDRATLGEAIGIAALLLLPPWRFVSVLVTGALAILALPVLALLAPHAPPARPHLGALAVADGALLLALIMAMRIEAAQRTIFLHVMRNELSGMALDQANAEVLRLSTTDGLTGFANRRHFDAELARLWRDRGRSDVGIALIEVDAFGDYIERAGPAEADNTLREVARALATGLRQDWDRPGRWQDAAFAAVLPGVDREELFVIGERLRQSVAQLAIPHPGQLGRFVSISVGLAWCSSASGHMTAAQVLQDADAALFAAKSLGMNRVVLAGDTAIRGVAPQPELPRYEKGVW
jgi:diguanylate cyclase (GGDEF)-like protein